MGKVYKKISDDLRREIEGLLKDTIIEECQNGKVEEKFFEYEVQLQGVRFITYMSDEELDLSVKKTIDILEKLKELNNEGMRKQRFRNIVIEIEKDSEDELIKYLSIWSVVFSKKLKELIRELDVIRRVGGAYAMLISNPCLKSAIYAVYDKLVDNFDDESLYCQSAYFLLRAIMRMRSNEKW